MKRFNGVLVFAAVASVALAACGGGGGTDTASDSSTPYVPPPPPATVTPAQTALGDGLLTVSGTGVILNGVTQTAVSQSKAVAASSSVFNLTTGIVAGPSGAASPVGITEALQDAAYNALTPSGWANASSYQATFNGQDSAAVSYGTISGAPFSWSMKLNLQAIGGKQAGDYLVNAGGAALLSSVTPATLPSTTQAAFPSFAPSIDTVIANPFDDLDPLVATEADMFSRTFCESSATSSAKVKYQLVSGGVLKVSDASGGCGTAGAAYPDGTWQTQNLYGKVVYVLTFPAVAHYESYGAYVSASTLTAGAKRVIVAGSATERWKHGYLIPQGVAIQSHRPFLTNDALAAIRTAAGL